MSSAGPSCLQRCSREDELNASACLAKQVILLGEAGALRTGCSAVPEWTLMVSIACSFSDRAKRRWWLGWLPFESTPLSRPSLCMWIFSAGSNDEGVTAFLVRGAHLFPWQAESREERQTVGGEGGGGTGGGDAAEKISSGCAGGIMRVPQSPARPSSCSSERSAYLQNLAALLANLSTITCRVCVRRVWVADHKWGRWLTARCCGRGCPSLSSLSQLSGPSPQFDGQRGLLLSNTRHCHNEMSNTCPRPNTHTHTLEWYKWWQQGSHTENLEFVAFVSRMFCQFWGYPASQKWMEYLKNWVEYLLYR